MFGQTPRYSQLMTLAALSSLFAAAGCGYIKRDEFQSEVDRIQTEMTGMREEMQAGDAALASRVDAMESRLNTLEMQLQDLEDEFGATVERLESAIRVHTPIHFTFDQAELDSSEVPLLDQLSAVLREYYPEALITVEGFTDPAGSAAYNLRLGQERADNVRGYLIQAGLAESQVRSVSYGEDTSRLIRPGAQGPGEEGRENRRVVIVIDHPSAWTAMTTN